MPEQETPSNGFLRMMGRFRRSLMLRSDEMRQPRLHDAVQVIDARPKFAERYAVIVDDNRKSYRSRQLKVLGSWESVSATADVKDRRLEAVSPSVVSAFKKHAGRTEPPTLDAHQLRGVDGGGGRQEMHVGAGHRSGQTL
eukprot:UN03016